MTSSVSKPVMGVVTRKIPFFGERGGHILVTERHPKYLRTGFSGIVCKEQFPVGAGSISTQPTLWGVEGMESLSEGDVIRIEPNGLVTVLYETASMDNAIFLTNRCNAKCGFCPQPHTTEDCFTLGEVAELVRLMRSNTEFLGITGGEPTLARDILLETIRACRCHLPNARIDLLTNGILLADDSFVKELAEIGHDGLVFEIPLYSDVPSEHDQVMGVSGFSPTSKGVFNLTRRRQKVAIRTVIHSGNYRRLPQFAEFVCRNFPFAYHVALMGLEVINKARETAKSYWIDPVEYVAELEEAVCILNRADINVSVYNHPLCVLPSSLWRFARASISPWKRDYRDFCRICYVQERCGGFFATSGAWQSGYLMPVGDRCVPKVPSEFRTAGGGATNLAKESEIC